MSSRPTPFGTREIADTVRRRITAARPEYTAGTRLPAEEELAEEFSVSRATVGRALDLLARDGLVSKRKRRGNFVAPILVPFTRCSPTGTGVDQAVADTCAEVQAAGYQPFVESTTRLGPAPDSVSMLMGVAAGTKLEINGTRIFALTTTGARVVVQVIDAYRLPPDEGGAGAPSALRGTRQVTETLVHRAPTPDEMLILGLEEDQVLYVLHQLEAEQTAVGSRPALAFVEHRLPAHLWKFQATWPA